jgi:hypothetical protein
MSKRKCKTCGRPVGTYGYGEQRYPLEFTQRVGNVSKDKWLQATSQFGSSYSQDYKEVRWRFPANENSHGLFCRQMCMYAFIGQYNEQIASLPDLVQV